MSRMIHCLVALVVLGLLLSGCESDSSPDEITFRNSSDRVVTVSVRNRTPTDYVQTFRLDPGGEWQSLKIFLDPLEYTYSPVATVSDRRSGDVVIFE